MHKYLLVLIGLAAFYLSGCNNPNEKQQEMVKKATIPVIIGTYTQKEGHVDGKGEGIYVYELDTISGLLNFKSKTEGLVNPSYLAASNNSVVAVSEINPGKLYYYQYNKADTSLKLKKMVSSYGAYPCYVSLTKDGMYALGANYGNGAIAAYKIMDNDIEFLDSVAHKGSGLTPRQESAHAHMAISDPENPAIVYAVDLGIDKINVYDFESEKLNLAYSINMPAGSGPRQLAFHPKKSMIYVLNELSGTVALLQQDSLSQFKFDHEYQMMDSVSSNDAGAADIQITPDGNFLFASIRGGVNKIFIYSIQEDGSLTLAGNVSSGGKTPRAIKVDPTGKFLFSLNQDSDNIVTYRIGERGMLDSIANTKVMTPVSMAFLSY